MLESLNVMTQLIFIMLALAVLGVPLLFFLKRNVMPDSDMNVIQALVISVYFGSVLLYILALIPLPLFQYEVLIAMLLSSLTFALLRLTVSMKKDREQLLIKLKRDSLEILLASALFLTSLAVQVVPLTTLIFGSIHDTSLHALYAQLIIENGRIPETHEPYLPAAIIFPQGAHVIFAFSSLVLNISTPLAVFRITPLFNTLATLAAYHFGKVLDGRRYAGLLYAFIFAFVSMWPTHITWGGNTFVVGVPLFLITASFLKQFTSLGNLPLKRGLPFYVIAGLFLGYLAAVHLALFLVLVFGWFLLILITYKSIPRIMLESKRIAIPLAVGIALISPFIYRFTIYSRLPGGNINLPPDIVPLENSLIPITDPHTTLEAIMSFITTLPSQYNISPYPITRYMIIGLSIIAVLSLAIRAFMKRRRLVLAEIVSSTLCIASVLLFLTEPINPVSTLSRRANLVFYISLMLLLGGFNISLAEELCNKVSTKNVKIASLILMITISLYSPFIY